MTAELTVLPAGYATQEGVASSIVLVRDDASTVVVDPGMPALGVALEPLQVVPGHGPGFAPDSCTSR